MNRRKKELVLYSFLNDYSETVHPRILKAIADTNFIQCHGYGEDKHCQNAANYIREKFNVPNADVHFISGGTQTNLLAAAAFLRAADGIICTFCAHPHELESGALESTGHKLLLEPAVDGKLTVEHIQHALDTNNTVYTPNPAMVYIANASEFGTTYTREELETLSEFCHSHNLIFYIDGARLGSAVDCSDLTFEDYGRLCDAFYIGGTKNGAMFGEAMVIVRDDLKENFRRILRQRGAMLAKSRLLGIQFEELFRDDLFLELAHHANEAMDILRQGLASQGYSFLNETQSNQIFPLIPDELLEKIKTKYEYTYHHKTEDGLNCVRFVTSWATDLEQCHAFAEDIARWTKELHINNLSLAS